MSSTEPFGSIESTTEFKLAVERRGARLMEILSGAGRYAIDSRAALLILHILPLSRFELIEQKGAIGALSVKQLPVLDGRPAVTRMAGTDELLIESPDQASRTLFNYQGIEAIASGIATRYEIGGYSVVDGGMLAANFRVAVDEYAGLLEALRTSSRFAGAITITAPENTRLVGQHTDMARRANSELVPLNKSFAGWADELEPLLHRLLRAVR